MVSIGASVIPASSMLLVSFRVVPPRPAMLPGSTPCCRLLREPPCDDVIAAALISLRATQKSVFSFSLGCHGAKTLKASDFVYRLRTPASQLESRQSRRIHRFVQSA